MAWGALLLVAQAGLPWPLGSGAEAFPLRATYGQIEGKRGAVDLHFGMDILVQRNVAEGKSVRAMEGGTVVAVETTSGYRSGLVIRSDAGLNLLYLHLHGPSIQFKKKDKVEKGAYLGFVTTIDPDSLGRHLHVSLLGTMDNPWTGVDKDSLGDPRRILDELEDDVAPIAEGFPNGRKIVVRRNEATGSSPTYYPNDRVRAGELDVIAHLYDLDRAGSRRPLAPARIELVVSSGGVEQETFELDFHRRLEPWHNVEQAFYNREEPYKSMGWPLDDEYLYCFVLTNGRDGSVSTTNHWHAEPGTYELRVRAWDAANNVLDFQETLVVVP